MSNGDKQRVTRIKRIFQNNDNDSDTWIDVERIEELWVTTGKGADWQERHYTFDWDMFDDQNEQDTKKKRVSHPDDRDNFIDVPIREEIVLVTRGGRYQKSIHRFLNDKDNKSRHTHSRKIYHYDLDENRLKNGEPPSKTEDYKNARKEKDEGQYVEVEILEDYWASGRVGRDIHGRRRTSRYGSPLTSGHWQGRVWHFDDKGSVLLDDDPGALTHIINPDAGPKIDPPWRLDPLQNIVNVNWGGLAVIFGPGSSPAPKPAKKPTG